MDQIRRAIRIETDGYLAYVTPEFLIRREGREDIVWEVELPEAAARWKAGGYGLTPLFCGTSPRRLSKRCAEAGLPDLAGANGSRIPVVSEDADSAGLVSEAKAHCAEARAQLTNALLDHGGICVMAFRSFAMAGRPEGARLDVDWTGEVDGMPVEHWDNTLLPALRDIRDAVAEAGITQIDLHVLVRLNAALALGMVLPLATGIEVRVHGRNNEQWPTSGHERDDARVLNEIRHSSGGDGRIAVLELSLIADLARDATELAQRVGAGTLARLATETADRRADVRPVARGIAGQIGDTARRLRDEGVNEFHVLLASPAPLAFLIGRELHALGRVHSYFSDGSRSIAHAYTVTV